METGENESIEAVFKKADELFTAFESEFRNRVTPHLKAMPDTLQDSILYSVFGSGKRIRPRVVFGVGSSLGVSPHILHTLASAVELIHTYTLIHDDLPCMDNDDFRRGKPTNHRVFGEATALLAGDALMALSIDVLLDLLGEQQPHASLDPAELKNAVIEAIRLSSHAMGGKSVIKGQCDELLLIDKPSLPRLLDVFGSKTGALFALSFMLPVLFREKPLPENREVAHLRSIGETLGIAFQIADDLEDEKVTEPPSIHVRAYLSDEQAIVWIKEAKEKTFTNLPPELRSIRDFTESLFQSILEKCENAQKR